MVYIVVNSTNFQYVYDSLKKERYKKPFIVNVSTMGAAGSQSQVHEALKDPNERLQFSRSIEQTESKKARPISSSWRSDHKTTNHFAIITDGRPGHAHFWQTKNLFIISMSLPSPPLAKNQYIHHSFRDFDFFTVHVDAVTLCEMNSWMRHVNDELDRFELIDRIVALNKDSDARAMKYVNMDPAVPRVQMKVMIPIHYARPPVSRRIAFPDSDAEVARKVDAENWDELAKIYVPPKPKPKPKEVPPLPLNSTPPPPIVPGIPRISDRELSSDHEANSTEAAPSSYAPVISEPASVNEGSSLDFSNESSDEIRKRHMAVMEKKLEARPRTKKRAVDSEPPKKESPKPEAKKDTGAGKKKRKEGEEKHAKKKTEVETRRRKQKKAEDDENEAKTQKKAQKRQNKGEVVTVKKKTQKKTENREIEDFVAEVRKKEQEKKAEPRRKTPKKLEIEDDERRKSQKKSQKQEKEAEPRRRTPKKAEEDERRKTQERSLKLQDEADLVESRRKTQKKAENRQNQAEVVEVRRKIQKSQQNEVEVRRKTQKKAENQQNKVVAEKKSQARAKPKPASEKKVMSTGKQKQTPKSTGQRRSAQSEKKNVQRRGSSTKLSPFEHLEINTKQKGRRQQPTPFVLEMSTSSSSSSSFEAESPPRGGPVFIQEDDLETLDIDALPSARIEIHGRIDTYSDSY